MSKNSRCLIQVALLCAAIGMAGYGMYRGECSIILNKAINICLECIGLG